MVFCGNSDTFFILLQKIVVRDVEPGVGRRDDRDEHFLRFDGDGLDFIGGKLKSILLARKVRRTVATEAQEEKENEKDFSAHRLSTGRFVNGPVSLALIHCLELGRLKCFQPQKMTRNC
jgi:hypothetical protein